ncbi:hypothetical protein KFE25_009926 [Diacronema lutheri]|uniref:Uncharacterized protein n=1 Tax=Diacronema lutheri TaxID=2081491 RepID=A0A8J6CEG8_DIALT|nr:hypothetical protein KFE25_009926 [Diacronema lutheri]
MGRKPGSRLTQRKAKREVAKATRTTKYANQKGGGSNTPRFKGRRRSDTILDQPKIRGADAGADEDEDEDEVKEPAQIDDDKAIRAFQKKLRQIEQLKLRQRKGEDLNDEQLDKIGHEAAILRKIIELTAPAAQDAHAGRGRPARPAKRRKA